MTDSLRTMQVITGMGVGGAEMIVLELVRELSASGSSCEIVSLTADSRAFAIAGEPQCPFHLLDFRARPTPALLHRLARAIDAFRPHVVHAHMFHALLITLLVRPLLRSCPRVVFTSHVTEIRSPVRRALLRGTRRWRDADVIFMQDQHPQLNAEDRAIISNGVVVRNVPDRVPRRAEAPIRYISVGRLVAQKDPVGLLHAFADAEVANSTLIYVGDGPERDRLAAAISSRELEGRVELLGVRSDVRALLSSSDVFVMHSDREGLPVAMLEAGAEARPVVSTPAGSIPNLLGQGRGYLADKGPDFIKALRDVARDPTEATVRGRRLHNYVRKHASTAAMATLHQQLYDRLRRDGPRRAR